MTHTQIADTLSDMSRWKSAFPNPKTRAVFDKIGHGMRLGVPREPGIPARLLRDERFRPGPELAEQDLSASTVKELLDSGLLAELTEHRNNGKVGWREASLPGDRYHIYACLQ